MLLFKFHFGAMCVRCDPRVQHVAPRNTITTGSGHTKNERGKKERQDEEEEEKKNQHTNKMEIVRVRLILVLMGI